MTSCVHNVRQLCLVTAVVSALATVATGAPIHNCDWDAAASIDPSIRIMRMSFDEPRLMKGYAVRVDLNDRSLAFTANGRDKDWGRPMPDYTNEVIRTRRVTVSEFLDDARAPVSQGGRGLDMLLAFNSAPWKWIDDYNPYADLWGLNISDGVVVTEGDKPAPMFVVWKNGQTDIVGSLPPSRRGDVMLGHSGFDIVLKGGKILYPPDGGIHPLTAVGLSGDRRWLYVVVVEGRHKGVSMGADYNDLARIMLSLGAADALNFDGGGSSALSYWDSSEKRQVVRFQQEEPPRPCALNIGIYRQASKGKGKLK